MILTSTQDENNYIEKMQERMIQTVKQSTLIK